MVITRQHLFVFFLGMLLCSLAISPFFLSVSMIAIGVLALLNVEWHHTRPYIALHSEGIKRLSRAHRYPEFLAICLIYIILFWGVWDIRDPEYLMTRLRIKIPLLLFPLAFIALPALTRKQLSGIFVFFILVISILSMYVLGNYLLHFEEIHALLKQGHPMPTPYNHIRFSLLVVVAITGGIWLWQTGYHWKFPWERTLYRGLTIFLFVFIHILSVKTGLVALYVMCFVLLAYYLYHTRSGLKTTLIFLAIILFPLLAYFTFPSLQKKIEYTFFDLRMYQKGQGGDYADAGRLASMEAGVKIAGSHWLAGTGPGNLKIVMREVMEQNFPEYKSTLMPHSQYITVLAGAGLSGFIVFLTGLYFPLFHNRNYKHWPMLAFYSILISIFFIEATLENAAGVGFSIFFLLAFLSVFSKESSENRHAAQ